jgi:hypothetical protein
MTIPEGSGDEAADAFVKSLLDVLGGIEKEVTAKSKLHKLH